MFRTRLIASLLATSFLATACDVNEGPAEELGEAIDAAKERQPLENIKNEAGDVFERRTALDRRLDSVGDWIADRRKDIADGSRDFGDGAEAQLDDLEQRLDKARQNVKDGTEEMGDDLDKAVADLEREIDELFDKKEE